MLTKTLKVGDEVFVIDTLSYNKVNIVGVRNISRVGKKYLYCLIHAIDKQFNFDGKSKSGSYQLWDSLESYNQKCEHDAKISKIKKTTSDFNFGKNLSDKALNEILQLIIPQEKN